MDAARLRYAPIANAVDPCLYSPSSRNTLRGVASSTKPASQQLRVIMGLLPQIRSSSLDDTNERLPTSSLKQHNSRRLLQTLGRALHRIEKENYLLVDSARHIGQIGREESTWLQNKTKGGSVWVGKHASLSSHVWTFTGDAQNFLPREIGGSVSHANNAARPQD